MSNGDASTHNNLLQNKTKKKKFAEVIKELIASRKKTSTLQENDVFELIGSYKFKKEPDDQSADLLELLDGQDSDIIDDDKDDKYTHRKTGAHKTDNMTTIKSTKGYGSGQVDWRSGSFYSSRYNYGCFVLFLFSFLSFFSGIIYYEYDWKLVFLDKVRTEELANMLVVGSEDHAIYEQRKLYLEYETSYTNVRDCALYSIFVLSFMTEFTFTTIHAAYIDWKKTINDIGQDSTFVRSHEFRNYLINLLMLMIQPYFFINNEKFSMSIDGYFGEDGKNTLFNAKYNYIFLILFLPIRYWHMMRYLIVSSYYYSPRAQRFAKMYSSEVNLFFAVKCILKSYPMIILMILFFSNVVLGGFLIRIWERIPISKPGANFDSLETCIWYAFITMCTVGYGDFHADSYPGRILTMIVAIFGVFINSTLTVVMTENFTFKGGELMAYNMLNQIALKEKLDELSKTLCAKCFRLFHVKLHKNQIVNNPKLLKVYTQLENRITMERDLTLKMLKELKEYIKNSFTLDSIDVVLDKVAGIKKAIQGVTTIVNNFDDIVEKNKENQRNLETLKNVIKSSDNK